MSIYSANRPGPLFARGVSVAVNASAGARAVTTTAVDDDLRAVIPALDRPRPAR